MRVVCYNPGRTMGHVRTITMVRGGSSLSSWRTIPLMLVVHNARAASYTGIATPIHILMRIIRCV